MEATGGLTKETKELVEGLLELTILIADQLKDGAQITDIPALLIKIQGNDKILSAIKGVSSVPAEVKNISVVDGVDLGIMVLGFVPKLLKSLGRS